MSLYIIDPNAGYYTGIIQFPDLDGSGQINVYDQLVTDLLPTAVSTEFQLTFGWRVVYRAITKIVVENYDDCSKYSGYPDRYNFGQLRWLRGGYAEQQYYIDTHLWVEPNRRSCFIAANEERTPGFGDPFATVGTPITTDLLLALSQADPGGRLYPTDRGACDQLAYYLQRNLILSIAVTYIACSLIVNPDYGVPADITLYQL